MGQVDWTPELVRGKTETSFGVRALNPGLVRVNKTCTTWYKRWPATFSSYHQTRLRTIKDRLNGGSSGFDRLRYRTFAQEAQLHFLIHRRAPLIPALSKLGW